MIGVWIGACDVPLLVKHQIRRPQLDGSNVWVHRYPPVHRIGGGVGTTSLIGVDDIIEVVDESLVVRCCRRGGTLSF